MDVWIVVMVWRCHQVWHEGADTSGAGRMSQEELESVRCLLPAAVAVIFGLCVPALRTQGACGSGFGCGFTISEDLGVALCVRVIGLGNPSPSLDV